MLACALWACWMLGFWHAFSRFNAWDDEGYFLLALRRFREHGGLYEQIRNVFYGPFYFEAIGWGAGLLHVPLDNASARWLMLAGWAAALAASALVAWRLCGSLLAAAVAVCTGCAYLVGLTNEPLHATSLVLICLALLLALCFRTGTGRTPGPRTMAACGVLCAAIALVKLNVGLFVFSAFVCAWPPGGNGRGALIARWTLALALSLLPFALMRALLGIDWVRDFALLVSASLLPFACRIPCAREPGSGRKAELAFVAGAALLGALSLGACLAHGTTLAGLWRALVLDALAFPLTTHNAPPLPGHGQILVGLLVLPLGWAVRRRPLVRSLLQLAAGLWVLYECLRAEQPFAALPFLWLLGLGGERSPRREFLGLLTVLLSLQAFPQAGAQVGLFAFFVPLYAVTGIGAAWRGLPLPSSCARTWGRLVPAAACIAAGVLLGSQSPIWNCWSACRARWNALTPLDLPGCGPLRLPEMEVAERCWLTANLRCNADSFVGLPGAPSAHVWSGVPAPVPFYAHHWLIYYDLAQEQALLQALLASRRPCIVRNSYLLGFWTGSATARDGPFRRALEERFELAGEAGSCQIWLPRGAPHELVLSFFPVAPAPELRERYGARRALRLRFPADGDGLVAHIALRNASTGVDLLDTASPNPLRRMRLLTPAGAEILQSKSAEPLDPRRTPEVLLLLPRFRFPPAATELLLLAYDPAGRVVARLLPQLGH